MSKKNISVNLSEEDIAQIKKRAASMGISTNKYISIVLGLFIASGKKLVLSEDGK